MAELDSFAKTCLPAPNFQSSLGSVVGLICDEIALAQVKHGPVLWYSLLGQLIDEQSTTY